jgi:hypothetical protein
MAEFTVFYSWQSDAPEAIKLNFIERALKEAAENQGEN